MGENLKSPFRLWLEGTDSQSSFTVPSPKLVERTTLNTSGMLFYEEEQTLESTGFESAREGTRLSQTPTLLEGSAWMKLDMPLAAKLQSKSRSPLQRLLVSPRSHQRLGNAPPSPQRAQIIVPPNAYKPVNARPYSPLNPHQRLLLTRQKAKIDTRKSPQEDPSGLRITCTKQLFTPRNLNTDTQHLSPKAAKPRVAESPRGWRQNKELPGQPYYAWLGQKTGGDLQKGRTALRLHGMHFNHDLRTTLTKLGRSQTPLERKCMRKS